MIFLFNHHSASPGSSGEDEMSTDQLSSTVTTSFWSFYGAKDFMGYPQMANVIRNDDGGTLFSDKPSFSDVVAWMEAANVSISMVHKMILGFFRHGDNQKTTLRACCHQSSWDPFFRHGPTITLICWTKKTSSWMSGGPTKGIATPMMENLGGNHYPCAVDQQHPNKRAANGCSIWNGMPVFSLSCWNGWCYLSNATAFHCHRKCCWVNGASKMHPKSSANARRCPLWEWVNYLTFSSLVFLCSL